MSAPSLTEPTQVTAPNGTLSTANGVSYTRSSDDIVRDAPGAAVLDAPLRNAEPRVLAARAMMHAGLRGRRNECQVLDDLLASVRAGRSRVLVLRGEAGIGKTALLDYLAASASGCRIAWAAGVECEMELAYAGLHQLCAPLANRIERLPRPQRDALSAALRGGDPTNRFLVGLAVLGLLSEVAEEAPLLWIVDDAQWLDEASWQTLAFVARRLAAESVVLAFAIRDPVRERDVVGLDELVVRGLGERDARVLLETAMTGPLDEHVRNRLVAETRGNPLALLELPRALTPAEMAGGFGFLTRRHYPATSRRASGADSPRFRPPRGCCCWSRRLSRAATRWRCGARRTRSVLSRPRGAPRRSSSSSAPRCASAIRSCDRRCTRPHRRRSASARTARSRTRRTRTWIATAASGIEHTRRRDPTRT